MDYASFLKEKSLRVEAGNVAKLRRRYPDGFVVGGGVR